jgi:hypothetical protein
MRVEIVTMDLAAALVVSGRAQSPESVQPAYTGEVPYMSRTCEQSAKRVRISRRP